MFPGFDGFLGFIKDFRDIFRIWGFFDLFTDLEVFSFLILLYFC